MPKFSVTVYVFRKPDCVSPEGDATLKALGRLGFSNIDAVKMGKCFVLLINAVDAAEAETTAKEASKKLLSFSVAEEYEIAKVEEVLPPVISTAG